LLSNNKNCIFAQKLKIMFPNLNPTLTEAWKNLQQLAAEKDQLLTLKSLFAVDSQRFNKYHITQSDILFDYSKNNFNNEVLNQLQALAIQCNLPQAIAAQKNGELINATEKRAVLHTALRNFGNEPIVFDGFDIKPAITKVLQQMESFCASIHTGTHVGYTGKAIKYIVNIGIGGSDLGPVMVTEALKPYWVKGIETYFVSNIDGTHISEVLKKVNAEETLFLIASKTFTTQETMTNAHNARNWFLQHANDEAHIAKHFVALSTNQKAVEAFGINPNNMFEFWDWVGGRYSLWSAIGLSIALTVGYNNFEQLLKGAEAADNHFYSEDFEKNIPIIMALIGIWNTNFLGATSEAILPYDQYLHRFAAYFQQGNMESNGKYVDRNGEAVTYPTGPIVWGEPGTNGQHAFYQLIHQGTHLIPCDFIATAQSHNNIGEHHNILLSNFFAQTQALMNGKTLAEVTTELVATNKTEREIKAIAPYKVFKGNIPTNSFLLKQLTPFTLGQIIAYYEHKIFVQGVIWNVYSYDQWGVELGKQLANSILPQLQSVDIATTFDSSTNGLINSYKNWKA
jgi:glucose-6-phosphate isomerase